jgi:hypothetical protein
MIDASDQVERVHVQVASPEPGLAHRESVARSIGKKRLADPNVDALKRVAGNDTPRAVTDPVRITRSNPWIRNGVEGIIAEITGMCRKIKTCNCFRLNGRKEPFAVRIHPHIVQFRRVPHGGRGTPGSTPFSSMHVTFAGDLSFFASSSGKSSAMLKRTMLRPAACPFFPETI